MPVTDFTSKCVIKEAGGKKKWRVFHFESVFSIVSIVYGYREWLLSRTFAQEVVSKAKVNQTSKYEDLELGHSPGG